MFETLALFALDGWIHSGWMYGCWLRLFVCTLGWLEGCLVGRKVGWLDGWLAGWWVRFGYMDGCLLDCLFGLMVDEEEGRKAKKMYRKNIVWKKNFTSQKLVSKKKKILKLAYGSYG